MSSPRDKIITLPDPRLRQRSRRIGLISKAVLKTIQDMEMAVIDWEENRAHEVGVALAASQIGQALRIIIVRSNYDDKTDKTFKIFINPVITKYEGIIEEDFEGCLSIKDIYGKVPRYSKIRIKAQDVNGKEFRITAEGFLARVLQHEVDHNNGVVFVDHIKNKKMAFFQLTEDGNLEQLDYGKDILSNNILW